MSDESRRRIREAGTRALVAAGVLKAAQEIDDQSKRDTRPRFPERHPLAGQLRDPLARFRETWGSDEEIHELMLDPLTPPDVKAACARANDWYLERHALRERDEAAAQARVDELKATAMVTGLDPERYAADQNYRAANASRVQAVLQRAERERQRDALDAELEAMPLPAVVEPGGDAA